MISTKNGREGKAVAENIRLSSAKTGAKKFKNLCYAATQNETSISSGKFNINALSYGSVCGEIMNEKIINYTTVYPFTTYIPELSTPNLFNVITSVFITPVYPSLWSKYLRSTVSKTFALCPGGAVTKSIADENIYLSKKVLLPLKNIDNTACFTN